MKSNSSNREMIMGMDQIEDPDSWDISGMNSRL